MAEYISLYSGSSGNCSCVVHDGKYIIIDMGKSARMTMNALKAVGLSTGGLMGVLVSHEHTDHIAGLKVFLKNLSVPVYSNAATLDYLSQRELLPIHTPLIDMSVGGIDIGSFFVRGFSTPHDSVGCMGFSITEQGGKKMTMATDLGCISQDILDEFIGSELAVIEANYDENMLRENIEYPYYLKTRISSNKGHLSNTQSAKAVCEIIKGGTKKIHLCHLSNNNNMPSLAVLAVGSHAKNEGISIERDIEFVRTNKRHDITPPCKF